MPENTSPQLPKVSTFHKSVILELDVHHAKVLARLLAHYDATTAPTGRDQDGRHCAAVDVSYRVEGYEPEVWHKVLIDLLTQRERARDSTYDIALVPFHPAGVAR